MANKLAGEVEFEAGDKKHVLRLDMNALISIQAAVGIEDDEAFWDCLLTKLSGSLKFYRILIYHGLKANEPDGFTEEEAGRITTAYGSHRMIDIVSEAIKWALPEKKEAATPAKGDKPRPSDGRKS
jgi:hypothetical protein